MEVIECYTTGEMRCKDTAEKISFFNKKRLQNCTESNAHITNMFQDAHYTKPIFQKLISRVLLDIVTRGRVFCIALGPVTICIAIRTIGLLYIFVIHGNI